MSSRDKIREKKFWGPKGPNSGPKLGFLPFSQIWFICFPRNCIPRCLTSSRGKIHKKKFLELKFGPKRLKSGPKLGFCHFLNFRSLFFLEIAYNDSFQRCITSSRGKTYEIVFGTRFWAKWAKIMPKIRFFAIL